MKPRKLSFILKEINSKGFSKDSFAQLKESMNLYLNTLLF